MAEPGVLASADDVLDAGVDAVGGVGVGALAAPSPRPGGQVRGPQRVAPPVGRLEERELGAGVGPLSRAKTRIAFGQPLSWSPAGPSRSSPVSSATCASSIQQAGCAQRGFWQASSARRSRTRPFASMAASQAAWGDLADRGLLAGAQRPADGPDELVSVPGGEPVELFDQLMAG
jgi:hypothetical protein